MGRQQKAKAQKQTERREDDDKTEGREQKDSTKDRAPKYTEYELNAILKHAKKHKNLLNESVTKSNASKKDALWNKITEDVNAVAPVTRDKEKIQRKWSDWLYWTKKKAEKNAKMTDIETKLYNEFICTDKQSSEDSQTLVSSQKNYDTDNKDLLISLISKHQKVLFGSFSNSITIDLKNKIWRDITEEMNKTTGKIRTVKRIQEKWSRMHSAVKIKCASLNRKARTSGINEEDGEHLTPQEERIKMMIGDLAIYGLEGGMDIDSEEDDTEIKDLTGVKAEVIEDTIEIDSNDGDLSACILDNDIPEPVNVKENTADKHHQDTKNKNNHGNRKLPPQTPASASSSVESETSEILKIERRKLEVMEEHLEVDKKRLKTEECIYAEVKKITSFIENHDQLPSFPETFSRKDTKPRNEARGGGRDALPLYENDIYHANNGCSYSNLHNAL